ncbi:hypothetical protein ACI2GF_05875, partial [Campylobacter coli]
MIEILAFTFFSVVVLGFFLVAVLNTNMLYSLSALAGGMVFLSGFYFLLELAIVHGTEYENAAEQRSYFGYKQDFLTPI